MAHIIAVNDVILCKVVSFDGNNNQVGINTLWYYCSSTTGVPTLTDAGVPTYLDPILAPQYKAWMYNGAQYRGVIAQVMRPLEYVAQSTIANAGAGTGGANALPLQVSGLITIRTAFGGRANRGRIYPPFPSTAWSSANGDLNLAGAAALFNISNNIPLSHTFNPGPNQTVLTLGINHRKLATITPVVTITNINDFATQRRRGQLGRTNISPI